MSDRDFTERNVLLEEFPDTKLLIYLYHVLRTFRREGVIAAERLHVLIILQRMPCATNEETYFEAYEELQQTILKAVQEHFNDNWHEIRDEWVSGLKDDNLRFKTIPTIMQKAVKVCHFKICMSSTVLL